MAVLVKSHKRTSYRTAASRISEHFAPLKYVQSPMSHWTIHKAMQDPFLLECARRLRMLSTLPARHLSRTISRDATGQPGGDRGPWRESVERKRAKKNEKVPEAKGEIDHDAAGDVRPGDLSPPIYIMEVQTRIYETNLVPVVGTYRVGDQSVKQKGVHRDVHGKIHVRGEAPFLIPTGLFAKRFHQDLEVDVNDLGYWKQLSFKWAEIAGMDLHLPEKKHLSAPEERRIPGFPEGRDHPQSPRILRGPGSSRRHPGTSPENRGRLRRHEPRARRRNPKPQRPGTGHRDPVQAPLRQPARTRIPPLRPQPHHRLPAVGGRGLCTEVGHFGRVGSVVRGGPEGAQPSEHRGVRRFDAAGARLGHEC